MRVFETETTEHTQRSIRSAKTCLASHNAINNSKLHIRRQFVAVNVKCDLALMTSNDIGIREVTYCAWPEITFLTLHWLQWRKYMHLCVVFIAYPPFSECWIADAFQAQKVTTVQVMDCV